MKRIFNPAMLSLLCTLGISQTQAGHANQVIEKHVTSNYAQTKYPLVFAHGMTGFNRIGTDQFGLDYWYQILPDLARNGANPWATRMSPFHSSEVRGEQMLGQVEEILALTGKQKVNLLGHSHGGHSIAYVANTIPQQVASATAISSPLKGSKVADFILSVRTTLPVLEGPLVSAVNFMSKAVVWAQGLNPNEFPHDSLVAAESLSLAGSKAFNQQYSLGMPKTSCGDGPAIDGGIHFYSFTGTGTVTNVLDPDSVLGVTAPIADPKGESDGLVARCSSKYGKTIRDNYNWNHLDSVNQILGLKAIFAPDPVTVYRQHANRLKNAGL